MSLPVPRPGVPPALRAFGQALYHRLFRIHLRMRIWGADRFGTPEADVPLPPAILRYRISETLSVREFLRVGEGCARLIRQHVLEAGVDFDSARRVLDFGCGCGRTLRWFLPGDRPGRFCGVDVDAEAVEWCGRHLKGASFQATSPAPPLPFPDDHFDIVYAFSVFTHLDEAMQDAWLAELGRILEPGGVLLLTVFGRAARESLDSRGRSALDSDGIVHRRSQKLRGFVPEWYHTTWHSPEYIAKRLSARFSDVRYSALPDGAQDIVTARKPQHASPAGGA
ncbi:MAG: class I SAM-dependent methyltransferase [Bryobacteraceae bacterium]